MLIYYSLKGRIFLETILERLMSWCCVCATLIAFLLSLTCLCLTLWQSLSQSFSTSYPLALCPSVCLPVSLSVLLYLSSSCTLCVCCSQSLSITLYHLSYSALSICLCLCVSISLSLSDHLYILFYNALPSVYTSRTRTYITYRLI